MTPVFNGFHRYAVGAEFEKNKTQKTNSSLRAFGDAQRLIYI